MAGDIDRVEKPRPRERQFFNGVVRPIMRLEDLEQIRPILETWIRDRDTGKILKDEVEEDLKFMRESIEGKNDRSYLAAETLSGEVVGVIGMKQPSKIMRRFTVTNKPVELVNTYVAADQRGKGVGKALVQKLEEIATERGYTEIVLNSGPRYKNTAWGFYDRLQGFQRVGIAAKLYGKDGDAPVWRKILIH